FPGISTGLVDLDRRISGLNDSDLIILAARPGVGKSSLAMNIGVEAAKHSGKSVAVFSLEMSRAQLGMRLVSTECLMDNKKLSTGRIAGEDEWSRVAMAVASLSQAKMYIDDDASLSVADINAKCRRIDDLGLVIVDYLQLMTSAGGPTRSSDNRQQIVSDMSRSLKLMAKELNVPVICLSQLSRANESRSTGQRRPMLSDLRDSGAIEQDADIVLFLYRESYYEDDTENPNVAECIVAKNRHGETGTVMLEWRPEFTTFRNLAYQYDDEDM
ncbi:MAG: DnaB-like helicase C-terminal domain-containing protein, partial [Oscillospiraceae bacterium]|nr:DnaB-like helicase C-terminal domain-containing protein [Oscillospiraceae bacterium]